VVSPLRILRSVSRTAALRTAVLMQVLATVATGGTAKHSAIATIRAHRGNRGDHARMPQSTLPVEVHTDPWPKPFSRGAILWVQIQAGSPIATTRSARASSRQSGPHGILRHSRGPGQARDLLKPTRFPILSLTLGGLMRRFPRILASDSAVYGGQARRTAVTLGAQRTLPIAAADTAPSAMVQLAADRGRFYDRAPVLSGR